MVPVGKLFSLAFDAQAGTLKTDDDFSKEPHEDVEALFAAVGDRFENLAAETRDVWVDAQD